MSATTPPAERAAHDTSAGSAEADRLDHELRRAFAGYQEGNREAFEWAYLRLAPVVRRYLLALTRDPAAVEDLVQDTFLQVHRARHTYDSAYPVIPWVLAIARHVYLMDRRYRRRRHECLHEPFEDTFVEPIPGHDEAAAARSRLRHALGAIGHTTREALLLHHVCGLSFQEIAARLDVRSAALRCRTSRALARMREVLREDE